MTAKNAFAKKPRRVEKSGLRHTEQLLVRNIDPGLKRRLRDRAEKHGHSMEEEARDILRDALKEGRHPEKGLGTRIAARFRGLGITEEIQELRGFPVKPPDLD